jgi:hypothetical protein
LFCRRLVSLVGVGYKPSFVHGEVSDISENMDIWPASSEDALAIRVDFAERDDPHPGSLEAEGEAADP